MKLKKFFQLGFLATLLAMFTACGDDSSSSAGDEESSSSVASFKSSSSLSTRADINYKKTISIGDTMRINLDLFKSDSSKMKDKNENIRPPSKRENDPKSLSLELSQGHISRDDTLLINFWIYRWKIKKLLYLIIIKG